MDADYSVDIFAIEVCEDIIIEVKSEGTEGMGVCKKWCIGVMVYFLHLNCETFGGVRKFLYLFIQQSKELIMSRRI